MLYMVLHYRVASSGPSIYRKCWKLFKKNQKNMFKHIDAIYDIAL